MEKKLRQKTLCYIVEGDKILLGMKRQWSGEGKLNGFGGSVKAGETIERATVREVLEEAGVKVYQKDLEKVAELNSYFSEKPELNQTVHVYFAKGYEGEPRESDEMIPKWFPLSNIPFNQMWSGDLSWLPQVIAGKKAKVDVTYRDGRGDLLEIRVNFVQKL